MLAMKETVWTKYACNLPKEFARDSSKNHSYVTLGQFLTLQAYLVPIEKYCKNKWSASDLRLQAYYIPILIMIASLFCPLCDEDYKHIWSLSWKLLQPYVVRSYKVISTVLISLWHFSLLFHIFIENLVKDELKVKRKNAFRELLKESNVNVTSNWKEIRRKIKDDVRYQKYRNSL